MKTRPEVGGDPSDPARLVAVLPSELNVLRDYSRSLWRAAYEPNLLNGCASETLWARSYSLSALEAAVGQGEQLFWVIVDERQAGFLAYRWTSSSQVLWLSKLYLHPEYWGRGLGEWILQRVIAVAQRLGARRVELYVFRKNHRAVKAYSRAGFKVEREEWSDLGHGAIYDDFVMVQELESSSPG